MEEKKDIKVNPAILDVIKKEVKSMIYRLDTLLESHYDGSMKYSGIDLMGLLEYRASAQILDTLLEEYMDIDLLFGEEEILIPFKHFALILATAKTMEAAYKSSVGNIPLWTH
jgi:hypothetical protein